MNSPKNHDHQRGLQSLVSEVNKVESIIISGQWWIWNKIVLLKFSFKCWRYKWRLWCVWGFGQWLKDQSTRRKAPPALYMLLQFTLTHTCCSRADLSHFISLSEDTGLSFSLFSSSTWLSLMGSQAVVHPAEFTGVEFLSLVPSIWLFVAVRLVVTSELCFSRYRSAPFFSVPVWPPPPAHLILELISHYVICGGL